MTRTKEQPLDPVRVKELFLGSLCLTHSLGPDSTEDYAGLVDPSVSLVSRVPSG